MLYADITDEIIGAFYTVYNTLGYGFLEKVYENALIIELNDVVILELKAAECLVEEHKAQLINYLRATNKEVGLLLNFGKKPQFERVVFTQDRKI